MKVLLYTFKQHSEHFIRIQTAHKTRHATLTAHGTHHTLSKHRHLTEPIPSNSSRNTP